MDTCLKCGGTFKIEDLCKDSRDRRGYRRRCHPCQAAMTKEANRNSDRDSNVTNRKKRDLIREAKSVPCADCGNKFPYYVMDLDHLPEYEKKFQLGKYLQHKLIDIEEELKKCEAVCANCHRFRTHNRGYKIRE
ncbi:HNH endonuclease [Streptomyces phage Braelyn]|uniref:HNH endonuclease n=1 Tax=Streptomyces phage Braelyn TaxID=2593356 RepID=A0A514U1U5_9CAUD|nr:HNH endonuclease [Streptomyces phage Braelyn]QDK02900.1 HNH endonuclease [Streptomyces phage Braelyn]